MFSLLRALPISCQSENIDLILLSFFILPLILTSQEISEEYLESLPASVKEDVLKGIDDRDNKNKPVYRRPSTMVKKDNTEFAQYKEFQNSKNEKNLDTNIRFTNDQKHVIIQSQGQLNVEIRQVVKNAKFYEIEPKWGKSELLNK